LKQYSNHLSAGSAVAAELVRRIFELVAAVGAEFAVGLSRWWTRYSCWLWDARVGVPSATLGYLLLFLLRCRNAAAGSIRVVHRLIFLRPGAGL
jgi:hypothetical protein